MKLCRFSSSIRLRNIIKFLLLFLSGLIVLDVQAFLTQGYPPKAPNLDWPEGSWIGGPALLYIDSPSEELREQYYDNPAYVAEAGCSMLGENYRLPSVIDINRGQFKSPTNWFANNVQTTTGLPITGSYFHSSAYVDKNVKGELVYNPQDYPNTDTRAVGALMNEWGRIPMYVDDYNPTQFSGPVIPLSEVIYRQTTPVVPPPFPFIGDVKSMARYYWVVYNASMNAYYFTGGIDGAIYISDAVIPKQSLFCIKEIK